MFVLKHDFYQEVLEVLSVFKYDLNDSEVERVYYILNHKDRYDSAFMDMFRETFNKVVSLEDQALLKRYFQEAFIDSTSIYEAGERIRSWVTANCQ